MTGAARCCAGEGGKHAGRPSRVRSPDRRRREPRAEQPRTPPPAPRLSGSGHGGAVLDCGTRGLGRRRLPAAPRPPAGQGRRPANRRQVRLTNAGAYGRGKGATEQTRADPVGGVRRQRQYFRQRRLHFRGRSFGPVCGLFLKLENLCSGLQTQLLRSACVGSGVREVAGLSTL